MLRTRKNKRYNEETNDEDDEGGRKYVLRDKIRSKRFEQITDLQELSGDEVTLKLIQRDGFDKPILVTTPVGLDLTAPPEGFVVRDVGKLVGYDRLIDVMDVRTQKNIEMTMKEWCKYYESRSRDRLLNVISLEFSHTDLDELVDSPKIIKQLDWVDLVWPKFLKESQTESTNTIDKMKYPKVQKYCLMSVKGSYTDFHIDFGGTSVWYHIIRGKKIFWMVPPTELSLQTFEEWTLSGMQQDVFFGDTVEECFRVELSAGNTFFIPSGWIHAVYTAEDSLVFGGNFLHSFGIENQLKIARIEDATKVPLKFRYPFYTEMLWYVVQHYVYCLTGKSHLHSSAKNSATTTPEKNSKVPIQSKKTTKRTNISYDSATESEQNDCDKTTKTKEQKAATAGTPPAKRKRGRPPKQKLPPKPLTDDESTEVDSDLEEVKPKKSATCRMTKNSLLRLQYEIDEPSKSSNEPSKAETCSKAKTHIKELITPVKLNSDRPSESQVEESGISDTSNNIALNGWSASNAGKAIWSNPDSESKEPAKIHITKYEVNGLKVLVKYLSKLSGAKKNMPSLIRNSRALLDDCKKVIAEHENDDPELAITGIPVTPELLNPKKSDINQLIEQFFKPDTAANGDPSDNNLYIAPKSKSDSTTLTLQQRMKYSNTNDLLKVDDKKNTSLAGESPTHKPLSHKETKNLSPNKKSSFSVCPPTSGSVNTISSPGTVTNLPRPKSPPTRPLSNKQYTSKTKTNDKGNLTLPDSFAGLIAATSSAKEVFNVSSADVASSLFGPNSSNKNCPGDGDGAIKSASPQKQITIDISKLYANEDISKSTPQKDTISPKPKSPEPPKISPTKRVITPSQNRIQPKERLIFASAPYVSPVFASEQSRQQHSWQSSTPLHGQQNRHLKSTSPQQPNRNYDCSIPPQTRNNTESPAVENCQQSSSGQIKIENTGFGHQPANSGAYAESCSETKPTASESVNNQPKAPAGASSEANLRPLIAPVACTTGPSNVETPITKNCESVGAPASADPEKAQKPHKPRGPPKKSKEARLVLESSPPDPPAPVNQTPTITNSVSPHIPVVVQSAVAPVAHTITTTSAQTSSSGSPFIQQKDATKTAKSAKRVKNSRDNRVPKDFTSNGKPPSALPVFNQTCTPVIAGLVTTPGPTTNAHSTPQPLKPGQQQYLISRPMVYNGLPNYATTHMQHMVPTSLPIFTTPLPTSMGIPSMQPGARIVWATRPRGMPVVTTAPAVCTTKSVPTTTSTASSKSKKQAPKSVVGPSNLQIRPDNAALLSLATTALSTAPLPTTHTLSTIAARLPSPGQAFMVNPNMFAPQHYFNPYMPRMPMMHFAPRDPGAAAAMMAAGHFRPGSTHQPPQPTTSQLLVPVTSQPGQPRYLITQPGFMAPRPQVAQMFASHPLPMGLPFAPYPSAVGASSAKEPVKVKKVKTR